jgi:cold shock CspA family protein
LQAEIGNGVKVAEAFIDVFEQESGFGFIHASCCYDQDE